MAKNDKRKKAKKSVGASPSGARVGDGEARRHAIEHAIEHASHYLPDQGPIGVFVHHNTLHAFADSNFHDAIAKASRLFGTRPYLAEATYQDSIATGRIRPVDLEAMLELDGSPSEATLLGGLSPRDVRRIALYTPIHAETPSGFRFLLEERALATRLASTVEGAQASAIIDEATSFLRETLATGDLVKIAEALVAEGDPTAAEERLRHRLGVKLTASSIGKLLDRDPEPLAVSALFSACLRLSRGAAQRMSAPPAESERLSYRALLRAKSGVAIDNLVNPAMIRICAAFLDEGMAYWPMEGRERGFFASMRDLLGHSGAGPNEWLAGLPTAFKALEEMSAIEAVVAIVDDLGIADDELESFVLETVRALPGWAGMFSRLERHKEDRIAGSPAATLADYLAVRLTYDREAIRFIARTRLDHREPLSALDRMWADTNSHVVDRSLPNDGAYRLFRLLSHAGISAKVLASATEQDGAALLDELDAFDAITRRRVLHEAYERRHRHQILSALRTMRADVEFEHETSPRFQAVFCIDEREESLRRALEETSEEIETLAAVGFFGLAMDFRSLGDTHAAPLCPVVLTPGHIVEERPHPDETEFSANVARKRMLWRLMHGTFVGSRSMVRGALFTALMGGVAALPMLARVLFPRSAARLRHTFEQGVSPTPRTVLTAFVDGDRDGVVDETTKPVGFAIEEAAERVWLLLSAIGLTKRFARLITIVGHGSSSLNNPHESAHDCGACGGRRGAPNARLFAHLANDPRVREAVKKRGITIPDSTIFIGGYHDTANDALPLFDIEALPETHRDDYAELARIFEISRRLDAHERCRRFEAAPRNQNVEAALAHVESRAENLAEPRPEYGHASNAVCIVGRREITKGLFLDRRAFLSSYDPSQDPDGTILERRLLAVGPVGAGINLEYYFSFVDNERYGSGTKLPHNITGLLGVMNGHSSDLRTGLPWQMVEIHEPVRLLCIVESTPERLLEITERQPAIRTLVIGRWIQLVAMDPETGAFSEFTDAGFVPCDPEQEPLDTVTSSIEWYSGHIEHLPPARIVSRPQRARHRDERGQRAHAA